MPDHTSAAVPGGSSPDGRLCSICDEDFPCSIQREHATVERLLNALLDAQIALFHYSTETRVDAKRAHALHASRAIDAVLVEVNITPTSTSS